MKKVEKSVCWICNSEYADAGRAEKCESKGLVVPHFKIGDAVTHKAYVGRDMDGKHYEEKTGTVIDVLFPVPGARCALSHEYQVSYLVRGDDQNFGIHYFDEDHIEPLQITRTVAVVREDRMFFENSNIENPDPGVHRSRRVIVTSWNDYVAEIERRNPQLKDRLARLTVELRTLDCLD